MGMELVTENLFWVITTVVAVSIVLVIVMFFFFQGGSFRALDPILGFFRPAIVSGG